MTAFLTYGPKTLHNKMLAAALLAVSLPAQAQEVEILALGDSLTQGFGLVEADGLVPQLSNWLADRGHDVRIINGGVSGDTTTGGLARVEWSLTPDIDGMIVTLGGNDLLRGTDPALSRANIEGILQVAQKYEIEVLLIGMSAPGNYGADYKTAFDRLYPDLAQQYDTVYLADFFQGLREIGTTPAALADHFQADGIHPNAKGVAQILHAVGPKVEELLDRIAE